MKNVWLGGVVGAVLGCSIVGGYVWLDQKKEYANPTGIHQIKTNDQSDVTKSSKFLAPEIVDARLNELSFKEVMRLFYKNKMRNIYVEEGQFETSDVIGLDHVEATGEDNLAIMHPIINYRNVQGEARFLVIIEKVQIMDDGILVSCHACSGTADLYTFKKLENGQYQVVSMSRPNQEYGGSYGRVHLNREEILNNMQPIGKKLIGTFYQSNYSNMGESTSSWSVIHLPEDDFIANYGVAEASGDNAGNYEPDSPLYFSFESKIQLNDNGKKYFPIQVNYTGDQYDNDYTVIEPVRPAVIFNFNEKTSEYLEQK